MRLPDFRYAFGAGMILNVLIGDIFVIGLGIDLARPGALIARHLASKATTQREMNHLYTEKADIYALTATCSLSGVKSGNYASLQVL